MRRCEKSEVHRSWWIPQQICKNPASLLQQRSNTSRHPLPELLPDILQAKEVKKYYIASNFYRQYEFVDRPEGTNGQIYQYAVLICVRYHPDILHGLLGPFLWHDRKSMCWMWTYLGIKPCGYNLLTESSRRREASWLLLLKLCNTDLKEMASGRAWKMGRKWSGAASVMAQREESIRVAAVLISYTLWWRRTHYPGARQ